MKTLIARDRHCQWRLQRKRAIGGFRGRIRQPGEAEIFGPLELGHVDDLAGVIGNVLDDVRGGFVARNVVTLDAMGAR